MSLFLPERRSGVWRFVGEKADLRQFLRIQHVVLGITDVLQHFVAGEHRISGRDGAEDVFVLFNRTLHTFRHGPAQQRLIEDLVGQREKPDEASITRGSGDGVMKGQVVGSIDDAVMVVCFHAIEFDAHCFQIFRSGPFGSRGSCFRFH